VDISGWYLSDSKSNLRKFLIPGGTRIPARGYVVFYEYQFNDPNYRLAAFALNSAHGDEVYLSAVGANATLTGYRASAKFGAAANGVSLGRFPTSAGVDFVAMRQLSFGTSVTAGGPTNQITLFRTGQGASNSYPLVGPIVISEIMYHPPDIGTNDNVADEFLELKNITANPALLFDPAYPSNRWRLRGGVDFDFPPSTSIPANGYVLVVSFDPIGDPAALASFRSKYGSNSVVFGPYRGKLDNGGESLELYRPDAPQLPSASDAGFVPFILVDRVVYSDQTPWPTSADGFGFSLQRINPALYGNEPTNWMAAAPTPGPYGLVDTDGDGMPDDWEMANGLNPNNADDANLDPDADGATNLQEYLAGTDPHNPLSCLKVQFISESGGVARITFTAVAGKTYSLLYRDSLASGTWLKLADYASAGTQLVTITDSAANGAQRFYRLITPGLP
jgi:hypothetical protein